MTEGPLIDSPRSSITSTVFYCAPVEETLDLWADRQTEVFYGTPLVSWSTGVPLPCLIRGGDNRDCLWVTHCPVEGQGEKVPSECLHVDSHWSLGDPMWRCCVVCSPGVGGQSMERRNSQTVFGCPNKHVLCRQLTRICGALVPLLVRWGNK